MPHDIEEQLVELKRGAVDLIHEADLRKKNQGDAEANEKLEWIDKPGGVAQIPVREAIKILAEKGLSGGPLPAAEKKK